MLRVLQFAERGRSWQAGDCSRHLIPAKERHHALPSKTFCFLILQLLIS